MNFYQLIKQQYENYEYYKKCKECPCEILRNKIFYNHWQREMCSIEMADLIHRYHINEDYIAWLCKDCRLASVKIAKMLLREEKKKELNRI